MRLSRLGLFGLGLYLGLGFSVVSYGACGDLLNRMNPSEVSRSFTRALRSLNAFDDAQISRVVFKDIHQEMVSKLASLGVEPYMYHELSFTLTLRLPTRYQKHSVPTVKMSVYLKRFNIGQGKPHQPTKPILELIKPWGEMEGLQEFLGEIPVYGAKPKNSTVWLRGRQFAWKRYTKPEGRAHLYTLSTPGTAFTRFSLERAGLVSFGW